MCLNMPFPAIDKVNYRLSYAKRKTQKWRSSSVIMEWDCRDDVDIHQPRTMGLNLVNGLVKKQLKGQMEVRRDNGTEIRIKFLYDLWEGRSLWTVRTSW